MFVHLDKKFEDLKAETINGVRYYTTPSGKKRPSITSVISFKSRQFFKEWRERVGDAEADKITKHATGRGTDYHAIVEDYLNNKEIKGDPMSLPFMMFEDSKSTLKCINNIHALEAPLYSDYLGLAGRVDCIAEFNKELAIVDFKTSAKEKRREWIEHYFVQEVAYAYMYYEMTGIEVDKLVTIITCETGDCQVFEVYDKMKYINLLKDYIDEFVKFHTSEGKCINGNR
jgi:genome maintenance exonuclease 1